MTKHRLIALAFTGLVLAACGTSAQDDARVLPDDQVPFSLLDADAPPVIPPVTGPVQETVPLCFVAERKLVISHEQLDSPVRLLDTIRALAAAPSGSPQRRTALGDPNLVRSVRLRGGVAVVDLDGSISLIGGDDQLLGIAQIVCTLTGQPGVGQVSFTLEGTPIGVPRGDGSLVTTPLSRDDYQELMA